MNFFGRINWKHLWPVILVILVGLFVLVQLYTLPGKQADLQKQFQKFETIYQIIKDNYIEEIPSENIFNNAFQGMLSRLDPYSEYLTPEEYHQTKEEIKGKFGGIGIEVMMEEGILTVISPLEDTPAFRAGVSAGDRILEIDGKTIEGLSLSDCLKMIRGEPHTVVTLTILSKGQSLPRKITLIREIINVSSIKCVHLVDPPHQIGYIQIAFFRENTTNDFIKAVEKLKTQGMKSLITDLRFNPGGLMTEAVELANLFINHGIIVSSKGRNQKEEFYWADPQKAIFKDLPLVVLINGATASAAEIFAAAIQDCQVGKLLGTPSLGKGLVQSLIEIPQDQSALRLTVARYYTPSGKCIQREKYKKNYGLQPDILVEMTPQQESDLLRSRLNPAEEFVDLQLNKAIEILRTLRE